MSNSQPDDLLLTIAERYARVANAIFHNQILPFPLKAPTFDALLCWHENADSDAANTWLRRQLLAAARVAGTLTLCGARLRRARVGEVRRKFSA